jgi:hypothetical protein
MISDNPAFENPYLDVEAKIQNALGENNEDLTSAELISAEDGLEFQLFNSFVKEKTALIGYVHDLIKFAAKR